MVRYSCVLQILPAASFIVSSGLCSLEFRTHDPQNTWPQLHLKVPSCNNVSLSAYGAWLAYRYLHRLPVRSPGASWCSWTAHSKEFRGEAYLSVACWLERTGQTWTPVSH
jgi:hypothetical protein